MKKLRFLPLGMIAMLLASCSSDDNNNGGPVNEEEVITTVTVQLTPQAGGTSVTLTSRDLDGDGPTAPVITVSDNLTTNTVYNGTVTLLNEIANPIENITPEVIEEALDHQFFFSGSNGIGTAAYSAPFDSNNNPIGVNFTFTTTNAANGNLTVILRHEPNKTAQGVSNGDIANAGGETDVQVTFPVVVE
ncbi:YajG family lipoprotein [Flavobacterium selenitireducens]|uniref:type 1 periplasmic binding fold superfamily protein n=1 Tax=Flavobacterium selenitireducens TaxID=2722704 RepID=UPI00168B646A|nr:type 1 periplasmic binding fold superfamily protein [Flavobacterium selenitireducens]MBD3582237.1 type 1 periplasmic binding fold superfamily protein [Flavobacterium selenitireducens]